MKLLYQTALSLYTLGIRLYSPFSQKASLFLSGRKDLFRTLSEKIRHDRPVIWIHSASVGEFEQARPMIERLRSGDQKVYILLTFFSPSGYELRKNYDLADWVFYLPMDSPRNAARFLDIVRPWKAIFVKYEFWYFYLSELKSRAIPTYLICALFKEKDIFFSPFGGLYRRMLKCYEEIFVQDGNSRRLLADIDVHNVCVSSDTRFDRVVKIARGQTADAPVEQAFSSGKLTLVAGSTWPRDEEMLCRMMEYFPGLHLILAPHEIGKERIAHVTRLFQKYHPLLYTEEAASPRQLPSGSRILVIDTIGRLSLLYRFGFAAYVGGGFGAGIHNTLEAAVYGVPVIFGPRHRKFKEALDLLDNGGGYTFKTAGELKAIFEKLLHQENLLKTASAAAGEYVNAHTGATEQIYKKIFL